MNNASTIYTAVGDMLMAQSPRPVRRDEIEQKLGLPADMIYTAISELRKIGFVIVCHFGPAQPTVWALLDVVNVSTTDGGRGGAGRPVLRPGTSYTLTD